MEPGSFTMGQAGVATPEHNVTLTNGFYLGKYEVTQAQYEAVMLGNNAGLDPSPSAWSGNPNRPVESISFADIQVFLTRLNSQQSENVIAGWAYTLPTKHNGNTRVERVPVVHTPEIRYQCFISQLL